MGDAVGGQGADRQPQQRVQVPPEEGERSGREGVGSNHGHRGHPHDGTASGVSHASRPAESLP